MIHPLRSTLDLDGTCPSPGAGRRRTFATSLAWKKSGLSIRGCQVPGNFELDLQAQGLIPEPFFGMNIAALRDYESAHIWYFRRFDCPPVTGTIPTLVFEGLDCFAEIFLNGECIGVSANALVEQVFSSLPLRPAGNELVVYLRPAAEEARKFDYPPGVVAQVQSSESLYVRKAAHVYGWDIMPRAVSAGIWRPVRMEFLPMERLERVWLETIAAGESEARLALHFLASLPAGAKPGYEILIAGACGESRFAERTPLVFQAGRISFTVTEPRRWWPRDRGEPALYDVEVQLLFHGREVDRAEFRHGIRTVELRRTSTTDEAGHGEFCFLINGERVFIRGTNWVPADAYHSRDAARLPRMLALALEANCNMLRCWGGNVYEPPLFFDFCDEHGIMVWQDFAMACGVYPQDAAFRKTIEDEARRVVRRLRPHASLVLWAGDNECDLAYDWYRRGSPQQNALTREILPRVLAAEDPGRPYLPSSPYVDEDAAPLSRRLLPEDHLWGPRDYYKSSYYLESFCHFASEIGYHGCPSAESVRRFISPGKLWPPGNDEWLLHATSPIPGLDLYDYRVNLMCQQLREVFGAVPEGLEAFAVQSQYVQAEAKKFFIEFFRGAKWRRTGILWWNLIDGWPQFSDAVVDYYFEKKMAFDFIVRAQQPLLVMVREPQGGTQDVVACNDTRDSLSLRFSVRDADEGTLLAQGEALAAGDAVTVLGAWPRTAGQRFLLLDWESLLGRGRNHFLAGERPFDADQYGRWIQKAYLRGGADSTARMDPRLPSPTPPE